MQSNNATIYLTGFKTNI